MIRPQRGHIAIWTAILAIIIVLLIRDQAHKSAEIAYVARIADLEKTVASEQFEISALKKRVTVVEDKTHAPQQTLSIADRIKSTLVAIPRLMPILTEVPIIP